MTNNTIQEVLTTEEKALLAKFIPCIADNPEVLNGESNNLWKVINAEFSSKAIGIVTECETVTKTVVREITKEVKDKFNNDVNSIKAVASYLSKVVDNIQCDDEDFNLYSLKLKQHYKELFIGANTLIEIPLEKVRFELELKVVLLNFVDYTPTQTKPKPPLTSSNLDFNEPVLELV